MKSLIKILKSKLYLAAKLFLWMKLLLIFFTCPAYARPEFKYSGDKKIETVIAANELNRIFVSGGEIIEVIGDENKYALYWSGDWRNLFIKPKVEVGEIIELSLIMPQGGAQAVRRVNADQGHRKSQGKWGIRQLQPHSKAETNTRTHQHAKYFLLALRKAAQTEVQPQQHQRRHGGIRE